MKKAAPWVSVLSATPASGRLRAEITPTTSIRLCRKLRLGPESFKGIKCWTWAPGRNKNGYGKFRVGTTGSQSPSPHRVVWAWVNGDVPPAMHIHHECENKLCCNPKHLSLLEPQEHQRRHPPKRWCVAGHDLEDKANVYMWGGYRHCKICRRMEARLRLNIPYERWKRKDDPC